MTLLCAMNDNGMFSKSFNCKYPGELETKLEQSGEHACFLDLVIKLKMGYLLINYLIKETNFHQPYSVVLCISRSTLKLEHFLPSASELFSRMLSQQANRSCFNKHSKSFSKIFFNYYLAAPLSTLGHY